MHTSLFLVCGLLFPALLLSSAAGAASSDFARRVDLDARLLIETRSTNPDGVTQTTRLEERLMRRGARVWKMRLNLRDVDGHTHEQAHEHDHDHDHKSKPLAKPKAGNPGHEHFNPIEFGRVVALEDNKPVLTYVKPKLVVSVPPNEFQNVGFDGSWHRAYYLVTPQEMARLRPTSRPSPVAGAIWHERRYAGGYERVLWDDARAIALTLESGSDDGKTLYRITVKPAAGLQSAQAWLQTSGYQQRRYSDYLD